MRVLLVTNMWPSNGSSRGIFVKAMADGLSRAHQGTEVTVELVAQDRGVADYVLAASRVRRRIREERPDVVWVHFGLTSVATTLVPRGTPLVITFHGSDANTAWMRAVARLFARRARVRTFVSQNLVDRMPTALRGPVTPGGVDLDVFRPVPVEQARRELGWARERAYVVFGGNPANPVKDYARYQRVLALVEYSDQVSPVHLPGDLSAAEVARIFSAADALLFTSRRGHEGSPTVVKEALAVNLPIVSVDVGDVAGRTAGVTPGGVVPWAGDEEVDRELARLLTGVLRTRDRSNGREVAWDIGLEHAAQRVHAVLSEAVVG